MVVLEWQGAGRGWAQCSTVLFGGDKVKSFKSIARSARSATITGGYDGHSRAVQGFKFTNPNP